MNRPGIELTPRKLDGCIAPCRGGREVSPFGYVKARAEEGGVTLELCFVTVPLWTGGAPVPPTRARLNPQPAHETSI